METLHLPRALKLAGIVGILLWLSAAAQAGRGDGALKLLPHKTALVITIDLERARRVHLALDVSKNDLNAIETALQRLAGPVLK